MTDIRSELRELNTFFGNDHNEVADEGIIYDEIEADSEAEVAFDNDQAKRPKSAFELRIEKMQDELDQMTPPERPASVADELHPDVKNLPHDSIIDYETNLPDVEYSD